MPRNRVAPLLLLLVAAGACDVDSGVVTDPFTGEPHSDQPFATSIARRKIVILDDRADPQQVARDHGLSVDYTYSHVLNGFAGEISDAARSGLLRDGRVVAVHRDAEVRHQQSTIPWGLDRIDQRNSGLDGLYSSSATGEGVTAYILDSGIRYSHAEFEGRASFGYDVYGTGGEDCNGHGTHVAATIGGRSYGVAKQVRLVSVKVLGCTGSGSVSLMIAALDWVLANANGPSVVNMSIAAPTYDPLDRAVQKLTRAGITIVVAAANYNSDACNYSPAGEPSAITVGASTDRDARASFSNWGRCVDLFAPGYGIVSAGIVDDNASTTKSGTSMAAPHVTGVAALYLQQNPTATSAQVHDAIKANATQGIISASNSPNNHLLYAGTTPGTTPIAPVPAIALSGAGVKQKSIKLIDLAWKGAEGSTVDVHLNGALVTRVTNSGSWTFATLSKSRTNYEFRICEAGGSQRCSNPWSITM